MKARELIRYIEMQKLEDYEIKIKIKGKERDLKDVIGIQEEHIVLLSDKEIK